jgi:hypothetical protein
VPKPSFALEVQRDSMPGAPNAIGFSGGFMPWLPGPLGCFICIRFFGRIAHELIQYKAWSKGGVCLGMRLHYFPKGRRVEAF